MGVIAGSVSQQTHWLVGTKTRATAHTFDSVASGDGGHFVPKSLPMAAPPPEEDSGIRNSPEKNLRPDCQISALLCISPRFWATIAVGMVARNEGPSPAGRCCHVASVPTGLKRQASGKRRS